MCVEEEGAHGVCVCVCLSVGGCIHSPLALMLRDFSHLYSLQYVFSWKLLSVRCVLVSVYMHLQYVHMSACVVCA